MIENIILTMVNMRMLLLQLLAALTNLIVPKKNATHILTSMSKVQDQLPINAKFWGEVGHYLFQQLPKRLVYN